MYLGNLVNIVFVYRVTTDVHFSHISCDISESHVSITPAEQWKTGFLPFPSSHTQWQ